MKTVRFTLLLFIACLFQTTAFAFRVYPTTAQDERMLDKSNFPFIAANADGFNLQHDCFAPFSASQVIEIFNQFTNKKLINHGVYSGSNIKTMSTMGKFPESIADVTAFMLYNEAPAMDTEEWAHALAQDVDWPLITHCRSFSTDSRFDALRAEIIQTSGIMIEFQVTDPNKFDDAAALMKFCVDNDRMVVFLTTFQQTPDIFMSAYKEFYYYLKENLGANYLNSDYVIFIPNTYSDDQVFPETLGYGSTFGVAHWLIDQKTKTGDGYIQPAVSITAPSQDDFFPNHKNLTVSAAITGATPTSMKLYLNGELVGEDTSAPYSWSGGVLADLATGFQELRVDATEQDGTVTSEAIRIKILEEAPHVPGFFKADNLTDYDLRNDPHEDGYIRHVYGKEWIDYTINVDHAGVYDVDVTLKVQRSKQFGGKISIKKGTRTLGSYTTVLNDPAKTPLANFTEHPDATIRAVSLEAGKQVLRMYFSRPGGLVKPQFYLYDFNFKLRGAPSITFTTPTLNTAGRYPDYSAPANIAIAADITSSLTDGVVTSAKLYLDDVMVGELTEAPYVWDEDNTTGLKDVTAGEHILKIVAVDNKGYTSFEQLTLNVIDRQPYNTSLKIPGTIKAIYYDMGGEGVAYHDFNEGVERGLGGPSDPRYAKAGSDDVEIEKLGGQYCLHAVRNSEWLNYTVSSVSEGAYKLYLTTSANAGKTADVKVWLNDVLLTTVPIKETGGFTTYKDHSVSNVYIREDMTNATIKVEFVNPSISNYLCTFRQFRFLRTGDVPASNEEMEGQSDLFSVYPNPATAVINIDMAQETGAQLTIFDTMGRCVYDAQNVAGLHTVSTDQFSAGTYFVKVVTADGVSEIKKIMIL